MAESHRGGFGEFGGADGQLIERTFRERIVTVGMVTRDNTLASVEASLEELALLVGTAGADVVCSVTQRRDNPHPATFVGTGKAKEIKSIVKESDCDTVVFDDELTPAQQFNLEKILGCTTLDRSAVILDIFAQNASTPEGKLQVELALLRYNLPRLRNKSGSYSQQAGGIGTRGPGETKIEQSRRRLVRQIRKLDNDLQALKNARQTQAKSRKRSRNRSVALVGYTNAGKSSVLNSVAEANVLVEDRLFATLDASTRRLALPGGEVVFLSDTVGFVKKLPHQLVSAFKTTLDVVCDADLLVHVVDASGPDPIRAMATVRQVLEEIDADEVPELLVFNKADIAGEENRLVRQSEGQTFDHLTIGGSGGEENRLVGQTEGFGGRSEAAEWGQGEANRLARQFEGSLAISAKTGHNLGTLLEVIGNRIRQDCSFVELLVPWDRGDVIAAVHREGQVSSEQPTGEGMRFRVRLEAAVLGGLKDFVLTSKNIERGAERVEADFEARQAI